jgi:DNA-directed RNA polymerase subunit H (RpoH/RPB5)
MADKDNTESLQTDPTEKKSLFIVTKTDPEKIKIIKNHVILMLSRRIYINKAGEKHPLLNYDDAIKQIVEINDGIFTIKALNGDDYAFQIIFQKITTTGKQSPLSDFFKEDYDKYKKIVIATDYNNKIIEYVNKQHAQIFKEHSLAEDIISHRDQPKFELLSPKEMSMVKKEYNMSDYTTKKYARSDVIPKYFALKRGDIIRIIRPSLTSGEAIDYRIVS